LVVVVQVMLEMRRVAGLLETEPIVHLHLAQLLAAAAQATTETQVVVVALVAVLAAAAAYQMYPVKLPVVLVRLGKVMLVADQLRLVPEALMAAVAVAQAQQEQAVLLDKVATEALG
jgi:hypothetical protein